MSAAARPAIDRIVARSTSVSQAARHPAVIGLIAAELLVLRQPWQLDGRLFEEEIALASQPLPVWHGFVHVLPWVSIRVGVGFLAFVVVVGLLAAFVASHRLSLGPAPALLLPVIPFASSAMATVLDAHFLLGLYLALLLTAKPSRWDIPTAMFAALNGPSALILAPFYLRQRPLLAAAVIGPAILQGIVFVASGRAVIQ